jgi:truncated hemoglobin YjbI
MVNSKPDIASFEDVQLVVNRQYDQLIADPQTGRHFKELNFEEHLPRIYNFWSFILGIDPENHSYRVSAFEPHTHMNLTHQDFIDWQKYLKTAVEERFEGATATLMLQKAEQLGMMFEYKLGLLDDK